MLASEAARIAGVTRQYLHQRALDGEFSSSCRLDQYLVFRREEIESWDRPRAGWGSAASG